MNHEILFAIGVAIMGAVIAVAVVKAFRRAFLVPEGYAGLLYHKGKFVMVLGAGRHIRWGRRFTLDAQDLRKATVLVAGQEVLTADNVGLKLSLLVTYQVTDPVKAAHETQNWQDDLYNEAQLALRAGWAESRSRRCSISGWELAASSWRGCSLKAPRLASTSSLSR